ncbi:hypothetical protein B9Z19DRAFT_312257 [Tuber borchii]|uniref:Secreted protein n=1 Tax=Tuber borchii TaxID=42251 RepID=A0A2T6ZK47_TUBBO|nr:hypothetical protein B9Z19DRAFT_312257 [Tuber borchii]
MGLAGRFRYMRALGCWWVVVMKAMSTGVERAGGMIVAVWHIKVGSSIEEDVCIRNLPKHTDLILFLFLFLFLRSTNAVLINAVQCN